MKLTISERMSWRPSEAEDSFKNRSRANIVPGSNSHFQALAEPVSYIRYFYTFVHNTLFSETKRSTSKRAFAI